MRFPRALTRNVPVLVLVGTNFSVEDDVRYVGLNFDERSAPTQASLCVCGGPPPRDVLSPEASSYGATVDSGHWVTGGITYCGMSTRELILCWSREVAEELLLPQVTVITFAAYHGPLDELRENLRTVLSWERFDPPKLELGSPSGPDPKSGFRVIMEWAERLDLPRPGAAPAGQLALFQPE